LHLAGLWLWCGGFSRPELQSVLAPRDRDPVSLVGESFQEVFSPLGEASIISKINESGRPAEARPVALVTGAAKRLGAVMSRLLHGDGFDIAVHYNRSDDDAEKLVQELNASRAQSAFALQQDLADADCGTHLIAKLEAERGRLDLLVNNAAVFDRSPLDETDLATWERIQAINLRAPYFLSLNAAPLLRTTGGSIINIGDIHASRPRPDYSIYCTSKAGVVAMTQALALELAPEVRVNCVAPGAILWAASEDDELQAATVRATPLRRCGDPDDIAKAVSYLSTATYVTGHVLHVDGGRLLRA